MGAALGWFLGMVPYDNAIWALLLLLCLLLRCNLGLAVVFALLGRALIIPLDVEAIGFGVLQWPALVDLWTQAYNTPYVAISGFNRSDVMGGLTVALALSIVSFPFLLRISYLYQTYVWKALEKFWLVKALKGSRLIQWYLRVVS